MITRAAMAALYTPIYDDFMLEVYSEETQVHPQAFESVEDKTKDRDYHGISGLGMWVDATEAEGGGYEDPALGYPKTFTPGKFWKKFQVSFEAVDQDEYALLKRQDEAKNMGRGARAKVENDTANVLNTGFTVAGPDGQFLFDIDHPKNPEETSIVYDNLLTGAFSHDNLEAAEAQMAANFFDPTGLPIPLIQKPLILYPSTIKGKVLRVLAERAAGEQPDTTLRNTNIYAGQYTPVCWRYLDAVLGGSNTAWFIVFPELGYFKIIWGAKPSFSAWVDEDLELYKFKGRMIYDCGYINWRGAFGSTGL